jgi:hypothetical protein
MYLTPVSCFFRIVSRRALNAVGDLGMDYMRGRYLRQTYTRLERMYVRYYELPAAGRAASRTLAQLLILVLLNGIMGWMVGVHHAPCSIDGSCPRMWCALLWIVAVVGTGYACSTAVRVQHKCDSHIVGWISVFLMLPRL